MAEQESPLTLTFTISVDGQDAGTQEFEQEMVTIGKGSAAVLQINDPALADLHCAVQINDDGAITLLDLGSEVGTLLNGETVNNNTVADGDEIRAGKTVIKIGLVQPEPAAVEEEEADTGPIAQEASPGHQSHPLDGARPSEDALDLMLRAGQSESDLGINRQAPKILEVAEIWSGTVMNVRHFGAGQKQVFVGDRTITQFAIASLLCIAILVFGTGFFLITHATLPVPPRMPDSDKLLIEKWNQREADERQEMLAERKAKQKAAHEERVAMAEEQGITLKELTAKLDEEEAEKEAEEAPENALRDTRDEFEIASKKEFERLLRKYRNESRPLVPPQFEVFEMPNYEAFISERLMPMAREQAATGDLRRSWIDLFKRFEREYDVYDDLDEERVAEDLVLGTRIVRDEVVWMIVPGFEPDSVYVADQGEGKKAKVEKLENLAKVRLWAPNDEQKTARDDLFHEIQTLLFNNANAKRSSRARCEAVTELLKFDDEKTRFDYNAVQAKCLSDKGVWEQAMAALEVALANENVPDAKRGTDAEYDQHKLSLLQIKARVALLDAYGGDPVKADNTLIPIDKRELAMTAYEDVRDFVIETVQDVTSLKSADHEIHRLEEERLKEKQQDQVKNAIYLGLVIVFLLPIGYGLDEVRSRKRAQDFFVSSDLLPNNHFLLVEQAAGSTLVNFTKESVGFLESGGSRTSAADLVSQGRAKDAGGFFQFDLAENERFVSEMGPIAFFIHRVHRARVVAAPFGQNIDWLFLSVLTALLFVGASLGIRLLTSEYDPSQEVVTIPDRFVKLTVQQVEKEKDKKKPAGNPDAGEGAKAKDEEGKTGKKEAKLKKAKGSKVAVQQAELDKQIAESAGLLADLNTMTDTSLFGTGGLNNSVSSALGGLIGSQYGTQYGSGGLGSRGSGFGGGGTAEGIGGLGTKGSGLGGSGYGRGAGYYGKKGGGVPGVGTADPIVLGALDKSIIDRIVKQNLPQIRYCYQQELNKNPKLFGKLVVKFVIAKDGSVSSASTKASTLKNPIVEQCVNSRFRRMRFPKPKGGGIVIVSYPFVFNSQG
jgi:hypothetical protein